MTNTINFQLNPKVAQAFFQEVEDSGVSRHKFDPKPLVARKDCLYGGPASDTRRALQKLFAEAKRKNDSQHLAFIGKHSVSPGECLTKQLLEAQNKNSEDEDEDEDEDESQVEYSDGEDEEYVDDEKATDDDEEEDDKATASTKSTPKKSTPTKSTPKTSTPTKSTPKKSICKKPSADTAAQKAPVENIQFKKLSPEVKKMKTSSTIETSTTEESSISAGSTMSNADLVMRRVAWLQKKENRGDGSIESPFILFGDTDRPETTGDGFEPALVRGAAEGNHIHDILNVRKATTVGMEDLFSAYQPFDDYPDIATHSIVVRGPSQELFHSNPNLYHEEEFCDRTKLAHLAQQAEIDVNPDRKWRHWLIVFSKEIQLENYILSRDRIHIKKEVQEMCTAFEVENDDGKEEKEVLCGITIHKSWQGGVYWEGQLDGISADTLRLSSPFDSV